MKNTFITIFCLISVCYVFEPCFAVYQERLDNMLANVNKSTENTTPAKSNRYFFDPAIVEELLPLYFGNYDLMAAKNRYDNLGEQNAGYFSDDELFSVCWAGMGRSYNYTSSFANKTSREVLNLKKNEVWNACKTGFVRDLIAYTREVEDINIAVSISNYGTFNESCTPPIAYTDKRYANMYCISGKHGDDPAFEKAWITQSRAEGSCKDVGDGAGMTCFGVTEKSYPEELSNPGFSRANAEDIAYEQYYKKYKINIMPDSLRGDLFSVVWNQGPGGLKEVVKNIQELTGVDKFSKWGNDGYLGNDTLKGISEYKGLDLRQQIAVKRWARYKRAANFDKFKEGWAKNTIVILENGCQSRNEENLPILEPDDQTTAECEKTRFDYLGK